jgi:antitoxin ParD1/3/4
LRPLEDEEDPLTRRPSRPIYQILVFSQAHWEAPMPRNTSFILGDHFDSFVAEQVEAGRYSNAADVIRSGLRLLEEREARLAVLRRALVEGEESGVAGPLEIDRIRRGAREEAGLEPS